MRARCAGRRLHPAGGCGARSYIPCSSPARVAPLLREHVARVHARELPLLGRAHVRALQRLLPLLRHAGALERALLLPGRARAPVGQRRGQAQAGLPSVRRPAGHSLLSARQLQGGRGLPTHRCGQTPWRVGGPRGGRRALELLQRAQQRAKHAAVALLHGRVGVVVLARPLGRAGRLGGRLAGRAPLSPLPAAPSQAEVQGLAQGGPRVSRTRQPQHPVIT